MMTERIEILASADLVLAARAIAAERGILVDQLIRDLLSGEISRARQAPPTVSMGHDRRIARLRARLASDLCRAGSWAELDRRLKAKGYVLRAAGGGLALHDWLGDRRICKASELGFGHARLVRRLRAPFPGQPHRRLANKIPGKVPDDDDFDVIEPP